MPNNKKVNVHMKINRKLWHMFRGVHLYNNTTEKPEHTITNLIAQYTQQQLKGITFAVVRRHKRRKVTAA